MEPIIAPTSILQIPQEPFSLRPTVSLCGPCQNLIDNWKPAQDADEESFSHHDSITAVRLSAENGCRLCATFLSRSEIEEWDREGDSRAIVIHQKSGSSYHQLSFPRGNYIPKFSINGVRQSSERLCYRLYAIILPAASQGTLNSHIPP